MFKYYSNTTAGMYVHEILPFLNQDMIIFFDDKHGKTYNGFSLKDIPDEYKEMEICKTYVNKGEYHIKLVS